MSETRGKKAVALVVDPGYTFFGECKGTTKAGTPCKRFIVYANGYCRSHGGSSIEYMRERLEKIRAKAVRRARRRMRQ